jgi:hypothetical protein
MARVAVGNRRIAGMGKAFLLGPAIGVATPLGVAAFFIQL